MVLLCFLEPQGMNWVRSALFRFACQSEHFLYENVSNFLKYNKKAKAGGAA